MGRLTIQDIAKILVEKNGLQQKEANQFASDMFALILHHLELGEQVKIKGLGTFKIIDVEARESVSVRTGERVMIDSHSKVSFVPDPTMKELVNKPFSQFETVILNDGVEFDDIQEQPTISEEEEAKEDMSIEAMPLLDIPEVESPAVNEAPVVEETPIVEEEVLPLIQEVSEPQNTQKTVEIVDLPGKQTEPEFEEEKPEEEEFEEESRPWGKWMLAGLVVIALMALSAFGGFYYGAQQTVVPTLVDTVFVKDTIYVLETQNANDEEAPVEEVGKTSLVKEEQQKPLTEQQKPVAEQPKPVTEQPKPKPVETIDKYAQKDDRVRLGAYRIVGLDHEVKVLAGQTFYSICRAHLGPDMECYVEVFNDLPRNPTIKAGQTIKIPKLQLKKRSKQ